jgi:WD40 repeat protein
MFSPGDSKHLLTASGDQSVKLWDVVSGELLFSWNMPGCGDTFLTRTVFTFSFFMA